MKDILYYYHTIKDGLGNIYLAKLIGDRWYTRFTVYYYDEFEEYHDNGPNTYTTQKHITILREPKKHQRCPNCNHDVFIKFYSVWNKKIRISETWEDIDLNEVEKDHLDSTFCEKCRQTIEY